MRIAAETQDPAELEQEVYDAEEIQDLWIEKTTRLKRYLEAHQPPTTTPSSGIEPSSTTPSRSSPRPPTTTQVKPSCTYLQETCKTNKKCARTLQDQYDLARKYFYKNCY